MEELKSRGEMPITHKALASIPKSEIRQLELWQAEMRRIGAELCQGNYVRGKVSGKKWLTFRFSSWTTLR
jgi:hypothetical protein